jgi:hypothetical protein
MRVSRIETVIQFVADQQASSRWCAKLLDNIVGLIDNSKGGMPGQRA